jgi:hypothetical protein
MGIETRRYCKKPTLLAGLGFPFRFKEALNKWIPFMPFDRLRRAFDKLTTNGINTLPFVLSPSTRLRTGLSKDLIRASLRKLPRIFFRRFRANSVIRSTNSDTTSPHAKPILRPKTAFLQQTDDLIRDYYELFDLYRRRGVTIRSADLRIRVPSNPAP